MKRKKTILLLIASALFSASVFFACSDSENALVNGRYKINFVPAKTNAELEALRANKDANIIRSVSDFNKIIEFYQSPLTQLPESVVSEFRNGLVVRENVGIVGLEFGVIKDLLSYDDFAEVMSMFGLDTKEGFWGFSKNPIVIDKLTTRGGRIMADHEGYQCVERGSCYVYKTSICLSGC